MASEAQDIADMFRAAWQAIRDYLTANRDRMRTNGWNIDNWDTNLWDSRDIIGTEYMVYTDAAVGEDAPAPEQSATEIADAILEGTETLEPRRPASEQDVSPTSPLGQWWDTDGYVRDYLAERENFLVRAGDNVFNQVRDRVDAAIRDGASERELTEVLQEITNPDTTDVDWQARAQRIARTEVHTSRNTGRWGRMNAEVESGEREPPTLEWLSAGDARVRDIHRDMVISDVTWPDRFVVGGEQLRFPGDPTGSPWNIINCRCDWTITT